PPDRRGRIHENDVKSLRGFRKILEETFSRDLAVNANATASNTRGNDKRFAAKNLIDSLDSYWATDDGVTNAEVVLDLSASITFNVVRLREHLPMGQRVEEFALDQWKDGQWQEFGKGTSIGNCRLLRVPRITTEKVRLRITKAPVCPALTEFGLFS